MLRNYLQNRSILQWNADRGLSQTFSRQQKLWPQRSRISAPPFSSERCSFGNGCPDVSGVVGCGLLRATGPGCHWVFLGDPLRPCHGPPGVHALPCLRRAVQWTARHDAALRLRSGSRPHVISILFCTVSHGVLDAMTDGGLGVAFFAPWNNERYFLPWRPLKVPPIGIPAFFSRRGLVVLGSELLWVALPLVLIAVVGVALRRKSNSRRG